MALSEEALEALREYHRQYYASHKEQRKATRERYWERKAARLKEETINNDSVSKREGCGDDDRSEPAFHS